MVLSKHCIGQKKKVHKPLRMSVWDFWPKDKLLTEMFTQLDLRVLLLSPRTRSRKAVKKGLPEGCKQTLSRQVREKQGIEGHAQCLWSWL